MAAHGCKYLIHFGRGGKKDVLKLRILLLCAVLLGLAALSGRQPTVNAQQIVNLNPKYQVPAEYGHFRQFVLVNGDYWSVFEAKDGTVRVVKLERHGLSNGPTVMMEITRKQ